MPLQPPRLDGVKAWGAHAQVHAPHAQTASMRGAPTLRSMSPTPGRRQDGGLPRISCPSQGCHPTMTCVTLSHSNAMICLCSPHARTPSRRGAPTLRSISPHARSPSRVGGGRPRIACPSEGSDPTLTCAVLAHSNVMICLCSPHARTTSRRGAPTLRSMSPTLRRRHGGELPRIACPSQGYDPTLTCALISHSNVMICLCCRHARTASRRRLPTLRSMSPTLGRRTGVVLPRITCPSQGCYPTMTCVTLSHSNAMIWLCRPHARTASRSGAPTLRPISPHARTAPRRGAPTLSSISPHARTASRRGAPAQLLPLTGVLSNDDLCHVIQL